MKEAGETFMLSLEMQTDKKKVQSLESIVMANKIFKPTKADI